MLAADGFAANGLLLLAYPLHPAGRPEKRRDAHLPQIRMPTLCFSGTRDPLCTPSGRAYPDRIALAATGSRADQFGDQRFTMTLRFDEAPIWLTGCQGPAGPPSGRVLAVAGRNVAGATGSRIEATGSIAGVELSGGAVAQLAFALVLSVDLSAP